MSSFPETVKAVLAGIVASMAKNPDSFVKNPGSDFTRSSRLNFENINVGIEFLACLSHATDIKYRCEDARHDYFTVKSLEARLKYAEAGNDYEKLHALFARFSDETVALAICQIF